jgi:hypothetical protein
MTHLKFSSSPTTLRFSRRAGESVHDATYASSVERPSRRLSFDSVGVIGVIMLLALLATALLVTSQAA